jgi:hypothetical protein
LVEPSVARGNINAIKRPVNLPDRSWDVGADKEVEAAHEMAAHEMAAATRTGFAWSELRATRQVIKAKTSADGGTPDGITADRIPTVRVTS